MTIRVKMYPHPLGVRGASGIDQVVLAYGKHLPKFGVEIVHPQDDKFDLVAGHAGPGATVEHPFVCHVHGLHWTADYPCDTWQYAVNRTVINSVKMASEVIVPSAWVAEAFQRDMRFTPHIIPHGIDATEWSHDTPHSGYVLWNKNRDHDVCDATAVTALAQRFPKQHFVSTFLPRGAQPMNNVNRIGKIPHDQMKKLVESAFIYLSTVKETFCIGVLEAMAAGVPILGFDYGGNSVLVKHGRNGYLARPGDFDDLAEGLAYCSKYRDALGANGREMALGWTWESAIEKVAEAYRLAITPEPPTVAVVIPCYNLGDKVGRAIESVLNQTYNQITEIVVVDDGSQGEMEIRNLVAAYQQHDSRVRLIRQSNAGVATARNRGIASVNTKYASCLDADDAIAPEFIERCVRALEADRSLGIAYTGLWYIKPDGSEGLSQWPGKWNFDAHLKKQNQVPTCCVFRREAWERVGGYKSRYCPVGAGEEDAEMFLRMGAYGYKAKKVDNRGLFVYSWMSGRVSGDKSHQATDWTAWHPWTNDGKHPFASYATPERFAHPVRQYDQPTISVIIPVGPGHEQHVVDALDSLEAQTFRGWEAIVVWDGIDIFENDVVQQVQAAYPYVRFRAASAYKEGARGTGWARNFGVSFARAPLLIFLDADDWLYPEALEKMLNAWNEYQQIIYTDYVNRAIVNDEHLHKLQDERRWRITLKDYEDGTHLVVSASKAFPYDCERAQRQPAADQDGNYYIWCNVTTLIPRAWHDEIGGFDESLPSWEDVDYNWRLAKAGKCFHHLQEELLVYNFHMGHRREKGRQTHEKLLYYISETHKELDITMCRGCGSNKRPTPIRSTSGVFAARQVESRPLPGINDDDFVLCWYIGKGRTGDHAVVGAALHDHEIPNMKMVRKSSNPDRWAISYGYFGGGRKVKRPVHKADIAAQPDMWEPIEDRQAIGVPDVEKKPLEPPPRPAVPTVPPNGATADDVQTSAVPQEVVQPEIPERPIDVEGVIGGVAELAREQIKNDAGELEQLAEKAYASQKNASEFAGVSKQIATGHEMPQEHPPELELQKISGVTNNIAAGLVAIGCKSREDIARMTQEQLMAVKGVGEVRAKMILEAARRPKELVA